MRNRVIVCTIAKRLLEHQQGITKEDIHRQRQHLDGSLGLHGVESALHDSLWMLRAHFGLIPTSWLKPPQRMFVGEDRTIDQTILDLRTRFSVPELTAEITGDDPDEVTDYLEQELPTITVGTGAPTLV